jgi:GntR family transcriptional repressor for pyruvate dehydrogenase complex
MGAGPVGEDLRLAAPASRSDSIARQLREEILRGAYRPGDRLPAERDLAQRLGVNRASVREALRSLAQLGLVAIRPGDGARVRRVDEASLELVRHLLFRDGVLDPAVAAQVMDLYEMLVAGAARLAVERGSSDDLLHARELLRRLGDAATNDADRPRVVDQLFDVVTAASGNLALRLARNALGRAFASDLGQHFWARTRPPAAQLRSEVAAIDRAVVARDAPATEEAVRAMLRERRRRLLAILEIPSEPTAPSLEEIA